MHQYLHWPFNALCSFYFPWQRAVCIRGGRESPKPRPGPRATDIDRSSIFNHIVMVCLVPYALSFHFLKFSISIKIIIFACSTSLRLLCTVTIRRDTFLLLSAHHDLSVLFLHLVLSLWYLSIFLSFRLQ